MRGGERAHFRSHIDFKRTNHFRDVRGIGRSENGHLDSLLLVVSQRLREEERGVIRGSMPKSVILRQSPFPSVPCDRERDELTS